jgi:hypothetical protein
MTHKDRKTFDWSTLALGGDTFFVAATGYGITRVVTIEKVLLKLKLVTAKWVLSGGFTSECFDRASDALTSPDSGKKSRLNI